jgi:hypothetical protein
MAESKFKNLQNEVCDLPEDSPAPVKICPTCTIDPNYVEPTWWDTSDPYLNLKLCEYQVSITSRENPRNLPPAYIKYLAQKSVKRGIREIVRFYSKLETDSIICAFPPERSSQNCKIYLPPELLLALDSNENPIPQSLNLYTEVSDAVSNNKNDPADRFNLEALEVKAYVKDVYYGDNFETFKILVSIPAEDIDLLQDAPFGAEEQEDILLESQGDKSVILDGRAFKNNILQMKAVLALYGRYQSQYYTLQKISLLYDNGNATKKFYINKYPKQLEDFKNALESLLENNNYKLRRTNSFRSVDKIKITFNKSNPTRPYRIKSVEAKYIGCSYKKLTGLKSFKKNESVKNQTVMGYIANLEDMIKEIGTSQEPVPWLDFIVENTYPPLKINFGNVDSGNEELDSCIDELYLKDIKDRLLEEAFSFGETLEFMFSTHNCQTIEEYRTNNIVAKTKENIKKENNKRVYRRRKEKTWG